MTDMRFVSDSHLRSVAKGLSYRLLGTLCTSALSFGITGSTRAAFLIGCADVIIKLLLFWGHERVWDRIVWGRLHGPLIPWNMQRESHAQTSSAERAPASTGARAGQQG